MLTSLFLTKRIAFIGVIAALATAEAQELIPSPTCWLTFRGNAQLQGLAPGTLADNFKLLWTFDTEGAVRSSAVVQDGVVYVGSDDGNVYALELRSGVKHWSCKTQGPVEAAPLIVADRVYVGSNDGYLYAINKKSGQVIWKYQTQDRIVASANWVRANKDRPPLVLVGSYDHFLYAINAHTGQMVWGLETGSYINGTVAVDGEQTVFGGCDGLIYVVNVNDGHVKKTFNLAAPIAAAAAVVDDAVYIGHYDHQFVRIDLADMKQHWNFSDREFPFLSSPAISTDRVVFGSRARRVYCVGRDDGKLRWTFKVHGQVDSSPLICGQKVVFGSSDGRLYLLGLDTGKKIWSYQIGDAINASPAIADGMIIVGAEDGTVYAFTPSNRAPD